MTFQHTFKNPITMGLSWGIIGGISLMTTSEIFTKGILQILPYPLILIAALLTMRLLTKKNQDFKDLFVAGLLTFTIMSLIIYLYILLFINPHANIPFSGHLMRLGLIAGLGIVSSLLFSFIFNLKKTL